MPHPWSVTLKIKFTPMKTIVTTLFLSVVSMMGDPKPAADTTPAKAAVAIPVRHPEKGAPKEVPDHFMQFMPFRIDFPVTYPGPVGNSGC